MSELASVCVFCGSSTGSSIEYSEAARRVGEALAHNNIGLVYGGGRVGLMGVVADAVMEAGGNVVGVIPRALYTREIAHDGLTELHVVAGMHERKALMAERSSAFLALPGGIGTYEELFEILSWAALGLHQKPIGLLNVAGYFDPLIALLEHGVNAGFIRRAYLRWLIASNDPDSLLAALVAFQPPLASPRWINADET